MPSPSRKRSANLSHGSPESTAPKKMKVDYGEQPAATPAENDTSAQNTHKMAKKQSERLSPYSRMIASRHQLFSTWMNPVPKQKPESTPVTLTLKRSRELSEEELKVCFDLLERTSSADYKASTRGWAPDEKKEEMRDREMWYILVQRGSLKPDPLPAAESILGFLSFMITHDDPPLEHMPVGYIYEIHLTEELRGQGLGSFLIRTAEYITVEAGLPKIMLSVFTRNKGARRLYERMGYKKDQCSPDDRITRRAIIEADYAILYKSLTAKN